MTTTDTSTHTFHVEGMHCGSCALLIDDALHDLPGIRDSRTSVKQQRTTVQLDAQTSPDDVINTITELGYQASKLA